MGRFLNRYAAGAAFGMALAGLLACVGWRVAAWQAASLARTARAREALAALDGLAAHLTDAAACRCAFLPRAEPAALAGFTAAAAAARQAVGRLPDQARVDGLVERKLAVLERSVAMRQKQPRNDRGQLALTREAVGADGELRARLARLRDEADRDLAYRATDGWASAGWATAAACLAGALAATAVGLAAAAVSRSRAAWGEVRQRADQLRRTRAALDELTGVQSRLEGHFRDAQRLASVGRVTSEVVHDFNNLLGVILACSESTLMDLPTDHPSRGLLAQAVDAGHRAADLTRRVLAVGRGRSVGPVACGLNAVMTDLEPLLRRVAGPNVETRLALADGLPAVLADRGRLEQAVLNLVANARDAMPDGGRLTIETGVSPCGRGVLAVSDSGIGMDGETKARLFEPWFTTRPEGKGTGLGMAIVQGAVEACGGAVEVDSEPGRGTRVRVYLCLAGHEPAS